MGGSGQGGTYLHYCNLSDRSIAWDVTVLVVSMRGVGWIWGTALAIVSTSAAIHVALGVSLIKSWHKGVSAAGQRRCFVNRKLLIITPRNNVAG